MKLKKKFTQEFKQQAVEHYERSQQSVKEVARSRKINIGQMDKSGEGK